MKIKLTPTIQLLIGVVVCVLLLALGYFFVISPAMRGVSDAQQEIDSTQAEIQIEQNNAVQLREFQKDPQQFLRQIDVLKEKLPENVQLADVIEEIDHAAEESGLDFFSVRPATPVNAGSYFYTEMEVVLHGRYFNLVEFFNHVERLPRTMKVIKLALAESDDGLPNLQITLTVKAFFSSAQGVDLLVEQPAATVGAAPGTTPGETP